MNASPRSGWGLLALGLCLALGLVVATGLMSRTLLDIKSESRTVEVKGYAEQKILSDRAVWRGRFTVRGAGLAEASRELERQRALVVDFVRGRGFRGEDLELSPVQTNVLYARDSQGRPTNEVEGYALALQIDVSSGDIDAVGALARESSELVQRGIELNAWAPEYFYTKLDELKVEMLGAATADARRRAETLATHAGGAIGELRWARQGVFQITPAHSTEVSDYGRNDTSSREKSIKAVVTVRFALGR